MGLNKYRKYKDNFQDDGLEVRVNVQESFVPDFHNRNTIQVWDVSAVAAAAINKWKGVTLEDRSVHEITIVNNNNAVKKIDFSNSYSLPDNTNEDEQSVSIGAQGAAHFYATALLRDGNLIFVLRTGSQDKRNL